VEETKKEAFLLQNPYILDSLLKDLRKRHVYDSNEDLAPKNKN
jgi:hypothetical protein